MNPTENSPPPLNDPGLPGAERRIVVLTIACILVGTLVALVHWNARTGLGVLAGGLLSLINLYWIRTAADALVRRAVAQAAEGQTPSPRGGTLRALIHFGLLAAVFYAIFISHFLPIAAVLTGFFAAVGGIILEALWETIQALRRGFPPAQP